MSDHDRAALLAEADACGRTWGRQVEDMPSLITDLASALRAALTREAEMQWDIDRLREELRQSSRDAATWQCRAHKGEHHASDQSG